MPHRPTLKEVASAAGVHPATASRALNSETRHLVNANTAARVIEAARELGYSPNPIARSLKTSQSLTVGVVIPDITNPLFPPIVRGIESIFHEAGYSSFIVNTDNDPSTEAEAMDALRRRSVDGFIIATSTLEDPLVEELSESSVPIVLVNRRTERSGISTVTSDDSAGISLAVRHLYELGHRDIIHVAGPQHVSTGVMRKLAFLRCLEDLGLPAGPDRVLDCASWSDQLSRQALSAALAAGSRATAVVAANDLLALGCYEAISDQGLRCPDDISVVGFNDMPFMDKVSPAMTTIRIPHFEIGARAALMLLDIIRRSEAPRRSLVLPVQLMVRASTAASKEADDIAVRRTP